MSSGLYESLVSKKMLVRHEEVKQDFFPNFPITLITNSPIVLKPEIIPFISYPYEWCFSQLKVAALLTLNIQKEALKHGMSLKDASAYNIQFIGTNPIFIDTLSFEKYEEGKPWIAYRQFCEHFLAPLSLMVFKHSGLSKLSQIYLDGIPLELACSLLPKSSFLNSVAFSHLHIHSKFQNRNTDITNSKKSALSLSKKKLLTIIEHLERGIMDFNLKKKKSTWNNYGETHNYSAAGKEAKSKIISEWLRKLSPSSVWDLGCNTGEFSLAACKHAKQLISMDSDFECIEALYKNVSKQKLNILPLAVDITNPSPSIGWNNRERKSIPERGKADVLLALAVVHHLRITNNTPFHLIADLFSEWGNNIIVEFIPKEDSQIQRILSNREDIYHDLDIESFRRIFENKFEFMETLQLPDSKRTMCLLKKK